MKKLSVVMLALCVSLFAVCCAFAADVPDEISIGVLGSFSGAQAAGGQSMKDAIAVVSAETGNTIEINSKSVSINWVFADTASDSQNAAQAVVKMIENDGVIAIIGPENSGEALAAASIAQEAGIPLITTTGTNNEITGIGDFIFRMCMSDDVQGRVAAKYAVDQLKLMTAAVIYDKSDVFSSGLYTSFESAYTALGGRILGVESFEGQDASLFGTNGSDLASCGAELIYVPVHHDNAPWILKYIKNSGINAVVLGPDSWDYDSMVQNTGASVLEGAYITSGFAAEMESAKEFTIGFAALNGSRPSFNAAMTYEAAYTILNALANAKSIDGAGIRDAIKAAGSLALPTGSVNFDDNGDAVKFGIVKQFRDGVRVYVTSIAP